MISAESQIHDFIQSFFSEFEEKNYLLKFIEERKFCYTARSCNCSIKLISPAFVYCHKLSNQPKFCLNRTSHSQVIRNEKNLCSTAPSCSNLIKLMSRKLGNFYKLIKSINLPSSPYLMGERQVLCSSYIRTPEEGAVEQRFCMSVQKIPNHYPTNFQNFFNFFPTNFTTIFQQFTNFFSHIPTKTHQLSNHVKSFSLILYRILGLWH